MNGNGSIRPDLKLIANLVEQGSRVLDIGCGDGELLAYLGRTRQTDGRGLELSHEGVHACVRAGLSVIQGDADNDLDAYPDNAFDYVILSQTLQATRRPRVVLESLARIGRRVIVSLPNFGHWRIRLELLIGGRMPRNAMLSHAWYDTPNIHLCTIQDFLGLTTTLGLTIEKSYILNRMGQPWKLSAHGGAANFLAEQSVFLLRRPDLKES